MCTLASMETKDISDISPCSALDGHVLLRPRRVAAMLDMSRSAIYEKINAGEIPCVRVGRSVRVPASAIRQLLEKVDE
jgi:excisionase family DNA binding protein